MRHNIYIITVDVLAYHDGTNCKFKILHVDKSRYNVYLSHDYESNELKKKKKKLQSSQNKRPVWNIYTVSVRYVEFNKTNFHRIVY